MPPRTGLRAPCLRRRPPIHEGTRKKAPHPESPHGGYRPRLAGAHPAVGRQSSGRNGRRFDSWGRSAVICHRFHISGAAEPSKPPSQLFQPIDSFTYAQTALLRSCYWKQRGIPALRYCPKMGVASFRTCGPRHSCRAPHPRGLASFRTGSLRMREITHPLVPIRRCSPQKPQLSSYTVFTEG